MAWISSIVRYGSIAAAVGGVFAIVSVSRLQAERQIPPAAAPPVPPPTKPYATAVSASGILESLSENVSVGVPVPGVVSSVQVKVNDVVSEGDVLFALDDRELRAEELSLQARAASAKARTEVSAALLAKLEARLTKFEAVADPRALSRDDLDNLRQDVAVARAELAATKAEATAAEIELQRVALLISRLTVRAPRAATVLQVNVRAGEHAATTPKLPAVILGDTTRLQVRADVDEQNATRIRPGQRAHATLKGDPSVAFPLEFVRVEPYVIPKVSLTGAGTERVDTRVLQVIFSLNRPDQTPLYVGQQVDVFIDAP